MIEQYEKITNGAIDSIDDAVVGINYAKSALDMILDSMDDTIRSKYCNVSTVEEWRAVLALARDRIFYEVKDINRTLEEMPVLLKDVSQEQEK